MRCLAVPLSRRLMRSVLAVSVCIVVLRSIGSGMYVDPVPGTRRRGFADSDQGRSCAFAIIASDADSVS